MAYDNILFERAGGVAELTLNRPDKLNAFNPAMHEDIRAALDEVEADAAIRALLITGAGRAFCSGADLTERRRKPGDPPPDTGEYLDKYYHPLVRRITEMAIPVVCAVNGVAAGAGANVALACDIVLAARSASFIQAFVRIGLLPDAGGTWHLPRLVGRARARGLMLTAEPLPAEKAEDWGLIWKCLDDEALMTEARGLAAHLASQPTRAFAATKRALRDSAVNSLDEQLDLERDLQRELGRTEDFLEGVTAFFAKRKPEFKGR